MLFTIREIQAMAALLNRTPLTAAEQLYAQGFFQRLTVFCTPPPEPDPVDGGQVLADALDEEDKNGHTDVVDE